MLTGHFQAKYRVIHGESRMTQVWSLAKAAIPVFLGFPVQISSKIDANVKYIGGIDLGTHHAR